MLSHGSLIRGRGRFFVAVDATVPEGGIVEASASSAAGMKLPADVVPYDGAGFSHVLIVPELKTVIVVELVVLDAEGAICEQISLHLSHELSVLQSKARYLTGRTDGLEDVRNGETPLLMMAYLGRPSIALDRMPNVYGGRDVLCGRVTACFPSSDGLPALDVRVIDVNGTDACVGKAAIVDDAFAMQPDGICARETSFRAVIDSATERLVVWARFGGAEPQEAYCVLDADEIRGLRSRSRVFDATGIGAGYDAWFRRYQQVGATEVARQREVRFPIEPTFSFVVPLYKTPLDLLGEMAGSVLGQSYERFELVLVNASPEDEALGAAVACLCGNDHRVREVRLPENQGITLNTIEGIRVVTGDFVCFLDHDDIIEPDLLYEYVRMINEHPDCDLIYCDEDKYEDGHLSWGNFKQDFSWPSICGSNFVTHLLTIRRSVLAGFDRLPGADVDGSQDYSMTLQAAELARTICHVPKCLYHWRVHSGSTAGEVGAKTWAYEAGARALQQHYDRVGIPAKVRYNPDHPGSYITDYELPKATTISVAVMLRYDAGQALRCMRAVLASCEGLDVELLLCGPGADELTAKVATIGARAVRLPGSSTPAEAYLAAAEAARGELIAFVDERVESLSDGWARHLAGQLVFGEAACATARNELANGVISDAGVTVAGGIPSRVGELILAGTLVFPDFYDQQQARSAALPICMMVRREEFCATDGFGVGQSPACGAIRWCLDRRDEGKCTVFVPWARAVLGDAPLRPATDSHAEEEARHALTRSLRKKGEWVDPYYQPWFEPGTGHGELQNAVIY